MTATPSTIVTRSPLDQVGAVVDRLAVAVGSLDAGPTVDLEARLALARTVVGARGRRRAEQARPARRARQRPVIARARFLGAVAPTGSTIENRGALARARDSQIEVAAVGPHDAVHEREAEAEAAEAAGGRRVALAELVEDRLEPVGAGCPRPWSVTVIRTSDRIGIVSDRH